MPTIELEDRRFDELSGLGGGGSDAFVVMPSADLEEAVKAAVAARILNNGQSCINAKRFIVHRDVYETFQDRFVAAFETLRVGDPMDASTQVGPLALESVRRDALHQVEDATLHGARRLTGASRIEGPGYWFRPGILADIPEAAFVAREEVFAPVALLFRADSLEHAIGLANDSDFGLGSSVWTQDRAEQARFVSELEAGQTFVNLMVASDPRLPFGGVKQSGFGRELGVHGIRAFVNAKTVVVASGREEKSEQGEEGPSGGGFGRDATE